MKQSATQRLQEVTTDMIAMRAYQRFVERGGEHGHDLEDWLAAEEELRARIAAPPRRSRPPSLTRVK
jgi:hypothetical protein